MKNKILVIDINIAVQKGLEKCLAEAGYEVIFASDGKLGVSMFDWYKPDFVLIDIDAPILNGWDVCTKIRFDSNVPIVLMDSNGSTANKVKALKIGADNYIEKPFHAAELLACINAVMRRCSDTDSHVDKTVVYDNIIIDVDALFIEINGKRINLPQREMDLLYYLVSRPNITFTRNTLFEEVWGYSFTGDTRTVDVHLMRLRKKLKDVSPEWALKTVRGTGYMFELNLENAISRARATNTDGKEYPVDVITELIR